MPALHYLRHFGVTKTLRRIIRPHPQRLSLYRNAVHGMDGLEIGGPSKIFRARVPLYGEVRSLTNINVRGGPATTLTLDGTDLHSLQDASYDFVLSSHCLEHIANPIKALKEWQRVTRLGGALILVVPHYRETFDHRRPLTTIEHMFEDYRRNTPEHDATHLRECIELQDASRYECAKTPAEVHENWFGTREIHHHTFDERNASELLVVSGYEVLDVQFVEPFNILLLARGYRQPSV